jgi:hypothetical protein
VGLEERRDGWRWYLSTNMLWALDHCFTVCAVLPFPVLKEVDNSGLTL